MSSLDLAVIGNCQIAALLDRRAHSSNGGGREALRPLHHARFEG